MGSKAPPASKTAAKAPASPKYKLTYFNAKGRAEDVRLMFAAAGVKLEDDRIEFADWPTRKSKMPQQVLPVLEVDGKTTIVQSKAISRFVARELRLYGKNNIEATQIDQIAETVTDLFLKAAPVFAEKDADKKGELMKKYQEEDAPVYLGYIDQLIGKFGKDGHAVTNALTWADCAIFATVDSLNLRDACEKFPKVVACVKKVEANKNIAKWIKERPVTPF